MRVEPDAPPEPVTFVFGWLEPNHPLVADGTAIMCPLAREPVATERRVVVSQGSSTVIYDLYALAEEIRRLRIEKWNVNFKDPVRRDLAYPAQTCFLIEARARLLRTLRERLLFDIADRCPEPTTLEQTLNSLATPCTVEDYCVIARRLAVKRFFSSLIWILGTGQGTANVFTEDKKEYMQDIWRKSGFDPIDSGARLILWNSIQVHNAVTCDDMTQMIQNAHHTATGQRMPEVLRELYDWYFAFATGTSVNIPEMILTTHALERVPIQYLQVAILAKIEQDSFIDVKQGSQPQVASYFQCILEELNCERSHVVLRLMRRAYRDIVLPEPFVQKMGHDCMTSGCGRCVYMLLDYHGTDKVIKFFLRTWRVAVHNASAGWECYFDSQDALYHFPSNLVTYLSDPQDALRVLTCIMNVAERGIGASKDLLLETWNRLHEDAKTHIADELALCLMEGPESRDALLDAVIPYAGMGTRAEVIVFLKDTDPDLASKLLRVDAAMCQDPVLEAFDYVGDGGN